MFKVTGIPILADEMTVLETLKNDLYSRGILRFQTFKDSGHNIMTNCPFHSGGQERKPSFGISRIDGKCNCFSCGYHGTIDDMISRLFGYTDDGAYGRKWLTTHFITLSVESREPLSLNLVMARNPGKPTTKKFIDDNELDKYRYYHPYMYQRHLNDEIIEKFDVGYDKESECLTFPVWDENGNCVFVARRSVNFKYFNYPKDVEKPVYLANFIISQDVTGEVVIAESILNALTCWKYGIPAVALLGTGKRTQYDILKKLPCREYILALDPDSAGREGREKLRKYLTGYKIISEWYIPHGRDLNDLDSEILNLQKLY